MFVPLSMSLIIIVTAFKFRHLEKLPKVVLSNDEPLAVLHAQQLLTIIFYSGPHLLVDHLQSHVCASIVISYVFTMRMCVCVCVYILKYVYLNMDYVVQIGIYSKLKSKEVIMPNCMLSPLVTNFALIKDSVKYSRIQYMSMITHLYYVEIGQT